ncbi:putative ATP-grasp-modified RiPP [Streptomyces sp. NRAIS3]
MTTVTIPFGARAERQPYTIEVDGSTFAYDHQRQVNVMTNGTILAHSTLRASCTNTNWDSKNDDTSDPYMIR